MVGLTLVPSSISHKTCGESVLHLEKHIHFARGSGGKPVYANAMVERDAVEQSVSRDRGDPLRRGERGQTRPEIDLAHFQVSRNHAHLFSDASLSHAYRRFTTP